MEVECGIRHQTNWEGFRLLPRRKSQRWRRGPRIPEHICASHAGIDLPPSGSAAGAFRGNPAAGKNRFYCFTARMPFNSFMALPPRASLSCILLCDYFLTPFSSRELKKKPLLSRGQALNMESDKITGRCSKTSQGACIYAH